MKKLLFFVALSAATPCFAQAQLKTPGVWVTAAPPAPLAQDAPFLWRLQLRAGQKFLSTSETSSSSSQQIPVMPSAKTQTKDKASPAPAMDTVSKSHIVMEQNVVSSDDKGARIELVYRELTQSTKITQGEKVIYDSAKPPAGADGVADMLKYIVGARISYLLSSSGEISDIQGVEEYLARLSTGLENSLAKTPAQQKTMRDMMAGFVSVDALKSSIGAAYRAMPVKAVALGENWKYSVILPMMGTKFTQNGESTFVSRAGNVVTLAQSGDFSTDAGAEFKIPLPVGRDQKTPAPITQLDLHGTTTGQTLVDEATGMTLKNRTTQIIEGEMVMSGLTGKGSVLTIPMKVTAETVTTTEEVTAAA